MPEIAPTYTGEPYELLILSPYCFAMQKQALNLNIKQSDDDINTFVERFACEIY